MSYPLCYTERVKKMKTKDKITFIPPIARTHPTALLDNAEHGWLNVNGEILRITNIHHFDDFGVEQETLTLEDGSEFITQDGGNTFKEDRD